LEILCQSLPTLAMKHSFASMGEMNIRFHLRILRWSLVSLNP
jgi:hypothetical protein